jgi:CrcB protein
MFLIVGAGSFLGGGTRYLSQQFFTKTLATSFPINTMVVNILGSFIIGVLYALSEKYNIFSTEVRMFLTVGFCGGFTTFSTFSIDTLNLIKNGNFGLALFYVLISVLVGFLACFLGIFLIKTLS